MDTFSLKILELEREEKTLRVGIQVKGPYSVEVRSPKIALIFDNGEETRRIPIINQAYFPTDNAERFVIFAKYGYHMGHLFFQKPVNKKIKFYFELIYGENVIEHIPFTVSSDVKVDEDSQYNITFNEAQDEVTVELKEDIPQVKKKSVLKHLVQDFIGDIWGIVLVIFAILLIPVFLLESILAFIGCAEKAPKNRRKGILYFINHIRWRINMFSRKDFGITDLKKKFYLSMFDIASMTKIKKNRIVFISSRRTDLTGNFEFVHNMLKDKKELDLRFVLDDRSLKKMSYRNLARFSCYCATSKVILIDDYTPLLYQLPIREDTKIIQLWHACGAFKTFGYGRLGKQGSPQQSTVSHKNYDYAIVSSSEISKFYAEGFGISLEKAVATGVPRTDIFFDEKYKERVHKEFYEKYPSLKDKKIILFAPTFRGNGKLSGYYPVDKLNIAQLYEELGEEYAIIIKHHPFVSNRNVIPEEYADNIVDLSDDSELNDLLFVTDILITDYSSVVFEAALLNIPMLFYAFDLQRYMATRGFYYEYEQLVPGKIVETFQRLVKAIKNDDFEIEKQDAFRTRFFDDLDGKSTERTVALIEKALKE